MDETFEVALQPNGENEIKVNGEAMGKSQALARWRQQQGQGPDKDHGTGKGRDRPWT